MKIFNPPDYYQPPLNLTESSGKFLATFSNTDRFSKSISPLKEQNYEILVSLAIAKAVKEPINSLSINDLYDHRNEWHKIDPPPNLLDTPHTHTHTIKTFFYKYSPTSIYYHRPKLAI